jgi:hypothetical protein
MSKFCEQKKNADRDVGYGGLLHLPLVNKVNLKFTLWLFSKVDLKTRSMPVVFLNYTRFYLIITGHSSCQWPNIIKMPGSELELQENP